MKKFKKSWKAWIVAAFIAGILMACGALVYAGSGLVDHKRWTSNTALTTAEWNQIMNQIDSLRRLN